MKPFVILKFNLTSVLFLFFAFVGITVNAQENIRDQFLVGKIYGSNSLDEYIYDADNKLIKRITTDQSMASRKKIDMFEYENGRVSKIIHCDSIYTGNDYSTLVFYDAQGQLINTETYVENFMTNIVNCHYENGLIVSTCHDYFVAPLKCDTIVYDYAKNVIMHTIRFVSGSTYFTNYYEYDNNPKPNFGIDYLFIYQPLAGNIESISYEMGLSQNNMTKIITELNSYDSCIIYTYNGFGLPETYEIITRNNPFYQRLYTITYKQIASGISEPAQSKLVVYPNPTTGKLRITNDELRMGEIEIFDVMGRRQNVGTNLRVCPNETIDISHLPAGIYFLRVDGETVG